MVDYVSDLTTLLIKDILMTALRKRVDMTSTVDTSEGNVKIHVFDKSEIEWDIAKEEIFLSLNWNDLKIGEVNEMESIIRNLISMSSQNDTLTWLNQLYLEFNRNALFVCTLLHSLSHMEYEEVIPQGPTIAMASLNHEDDRVIGFAIKAFSNWNSKKTIGLMEANVPKIPWAKKEWNKVLKYIEIYGDDYELRDENDKSNERVDTTASRNS